MRAGPISDEIMGDSQTEEDKFWGIMDRFGSARCMLNVCHRSLSTSDSPVASDEAEVLAEAIEKLRVVYNAFDLFAQATYNTERPADRTAEAP